MDWQNFDDLATYEYAYLWICIHQHINRYYSLFFPSPNAEADITFGTVEVKVLYYETVFFHKTFDICEMAEKFEDEFFICPMAKGNYK